MGGEGSGRPTKEQSLVNSMYKSSFGNYKGGEPISLPGVQAKEEVAEKNFPYSVNMAYFEPQNNHVNIGVTPTSGAFQLEISSNIGGGGNRGMAITQHSNNSATPLMIFRKSYGTKENPTDIPAGVFTYSQFGGGYINGDYQYTTCIGAEVEQVVGNNLYGALIFSTSRDGVTSVTSDEKMRLDSQGNLGIGINAPAYKIDVRGTARIGEDADCYITATKHTFFGVDYPMISGVDDGGTGVLWMDTKLYVGGAATGAASYPRVVLFDENNVSSCVLQYYGTTNATLSKGLEIDGLFKCSNVAGGYYMYIEDGDADTYWVGDSSGLPYGSCYGQSIAWTQAAAQNTWYNISDTDMTDGQLNNVTHDGSGKLTLGIAGRYLINYTITVDCDQNDNHIETGIEVSGSGSANAAGIQSADSYEREMVMTGTAILDLAANATIEVCIRTTTAGSPTITVQDLNITVLHVGGT